MLLLSTQTELYNMSLGLDDRLLGEKVHNYCSSSEDEDDDDNGNDDSGSCNEENGSKAVKGPNITPPEIGEYEGHCTNVSTYHLIHYEITLCA